MSKNNILNAEKNIGIHSFFTPFSGVNGKLRTNPEDFIVNEISTFPPENEKGKYTIAQIESINWETNILIRDISNKLRISRNRIGFAGTKDKRAKKTQLLSFFNVSRDDVLNLNMHNVTIKKAYCSNKPIKIGDLSGNNFEIIIRNIDRENNEKQIQKITSFINEKNGFPNYYGIQRFGIIRPITHVVGKYIVKGDFKKAVMTYIANPIKTENEQDYLLREELEKTLDFSNALKKYPDYLNFEKAILNKLVKNPNDYIGALKELPKNLLIMFICAYQSYIFNEIISERINKNLPLNKAIIGDVILPIRKGTTDHNGILVDEDNIEKVNKQIAKGKAVVSASLIGSETELSRGIMGDIEKSIVKKEKVEPRDFIIPDIPFISSKGTRRPVFAYVNNLEYKLINDDLNKDKNAIVVNFDLGKGCYATSLLRELMKAEDIKNY